MVTSFLSIVTISKGRKKLATILELPVHQWTFSKDLPHFFPVSHRDSRTIDNFKIIKVIKFSCYVFPPTADVCPKLPCLHNCFRKWPSECLLVDAEGFRRWRRIPKPFVWRCTNFGRLWGIRRFEWPSRCRWRRQSSRLQFYEEQ